MDKDVKYRLLFVDDEEPILSALQRSFRAENYEITTSTDPLDALEKIKHEPVDLIISDQKMPQMDGVDFLEQAGLACPDSIRILLTGFGDAQTAIDAINRGKVYKFFVKPWNDEDLRGTVKQALKQLHMEREIKRLNHLVREQNKSLKDINVALEERVRMRTVEIDRRNQALVKLNEKLHTNFSKTLKIFSGIVETRNANMASHSRRVSETARKIAEALDVSKDFVEDVVLGAYLHDIGKVGLSDRVLIKGNKDLTREETEALRRHPVLGSSALMGLNEMEEVALMIRHHHETYDGMGFPDRLARDQIPLGARIIAVADTYDKRVYSAIYGKALSPTEARGLIRERAGSHFDPEIVMIFLDIFSDHKRMPQGDNEIEVKIDDLAGYMVISRDLRTVSGRLLAPKGSRMDAQSIERIKSNQLRDPVIEGFFVYITDYAAYGER